MRVFFLGGWHCNKTTELLPHHTQRARKRTDMPRQRWGFENSDNFHLVGGFQLEKYSSKMGNIIFPQFSGGEHISSGHLETGCHHLGHHIIGPGNRCSFWPPKKGAVQPVGPDGFSLLLRRSVPWRFVLRSGSLLISLPIAIPCV